MSKKIEKSSYLDCSTITLLTFLTQIHLVIVLSNTVTEVTLRVIANEEPALLSGGMESHGPLFAFWAIHQFSFSG